MSVAKLRINSLTTVMYDRQRLCLTIGLAVTQLPLLACLLGNDVVSEEKMRDVRNNAMAAYRCISAAVLNRINRTLDFSVLFTTKSKLYLLLATFSYIIYPFYVKEFLDFILQAFL